ANPVSILDLQKRMRYNTQIFGNAALTFHLADGLDLKTQFGIDNHRKEYRGYSSILLNNISRPNGWAEVSSWNDLYWQEETYLTYNKTFDKHRINAMAGLSWQERTYFGFNTRTEGFTTDAYEYNNLGVGSIPGSPGSGTNKWAMNSYFVRGNYSYDDRYSVTLTARADGSSKFGQDKKYGFFPSAGLAWNVSNEQFMKDQTTVSNLKLHTSYGITGNSEIDPYSSLFMIGAGTTLINGNREPSYVVGNLGNPGLQWEKTKTYDAGFELGLFENKLNFDISYYNRTTTELLLRAPVPYSTGFNDVWKNIGSVRNSGVEVLVTANPIRRDDLSWNISLNGSYNKNKVLKLGENNEDILLNGWVGGPNSIIRVDRKAHV